MKENLLLLKDLLELWRKNILILVLSKHFAKVYTPNWSEEVFVIKKSGNTVLWSYVKKILIMKKMSEKFMKTNCKRKIKQSLELR